MTQPHIVVREVGSFPTEVNQIDTLILQNKEGMLSEVELMKDRQPQERLAYGVKGYLAETTASPKGQALADYQADPQSSTMTSNNGQR